MILLRTGTLAVALALTLTLAACGPAPGPAPAADAASGTAATPPAPATTAAPTPTPTPPTEFVRANLLHCPWTADAVAPVLGGTAAGIPASHNAAESYTVHCTYPGADARALEVAQTWFAPDAAAAAYTKLDEQIAAQASAVDGDADAARWVVGASPGALQLVYTRANVRTEITVRGAGDTPELRAALLALPRLPAWQ
jgi:hypothetical protein